MTGKFSYNGDTNTATIYSSYNESRFITVPDVEFSVAQAMHKSLRNIEAAALTEAERLMKDAIRKHGIKED